MVGIGLSEIVVVILNLLFLLAIPAAVIYVAWRFWQRLKALEERVNELERQAGHS